MVDDGETVVAFGRAAGRLRTHKDAAAGYRFVHAFTVSDGLVSRFREELLSSFDAGKGGLRVTVDSAFPPARAAEAFQRLRENRNVGKIVIAWGDR